MNRPQDFETACDQGWYRVPEKKAPRGVFFEYIAFYFTAAFGEEKWAVQYYARRLGHELVSRRELLPDEADHPRADERYYKLQLGPLQRRQPPIVSLRWRRIAFIHTTWDRFEMAQEINDLFAEGNGLVDRLYHALRESGLRPERQYSMRETGIEYVAKLAVLCQAGVLAVDVAKQTRSAGDLLCFSQQAVQTELDDCLVRIRTEVEERGGVRLDPG